VLALLGAVVAAVGGVSLGVSGCAAVALAGIVGACLGAGIVRDSDAPRPRQAAVDAAWRTGVGTIGVLLVLSGCAVLAGGVVTALLAGGALGTVLVRWALRSVRADRVVQRATVVPLIGAAGAPVHTLSVEALGREWLRTSAALAQTRGPLARQALVDRRQQALDELERRDPAGFARWLADEPTVESDPARYIAGRPAEGYDAA
jgi:hypothetical protein